MTTIPRVLKHKRSKVLGLAVLVAGLFAGTYIAQRTNLIGKKAAGQDVTLSLVPSAPSVAVSQPLELSLAVNSAGNRVSAVQLALSYDPSLLRLQSFSPTDYLPITLSPARIDNNQGTFQVVLGSDPAQPRSGGGILGSLTFTAAAAGSARVFFDSQTQVAALGYPANTLSSTSESQIQITAPQGVSRSKPAGVSSLTGWGETPNPAVWNLGYVDSVVLRLYWKDLNPSEGVYQWEAVDAALAAAAQAGKNLKLVIAPGFYSPGWVLNRVPTEQFEVDQGPLKGSLSPLPLPWDDTYLQLWFGFLDELGRRYAGNSALNFVGLTGPNSHNGEVSLPRNSKDRARWVALAGSEQQLESTLLAAWKKTMDHFQSVFANQGIYFGLALILDSLPANNPDLQWQYKLDLIDYPQSQNMDHFALQTNGLDARPLCPVNDPLRHWSLIQSSAFLTGFQTRAPGNLYDCPTGISKSQILSQTGQNVLTYGADFIEIYESDILDPDLADTITQINLSLKGGE